MLKFTRSTLIIWICILVVLLSAGLSAHMIRTDAAGDVLSNGKEAYFFIYREKDGYHVKWIGYPLMAVGESLGVIQQPDDRRGTMYVIRITQSAVERHVVELTDFRPGSGPSMLTPIEGRIWTNFPTLGGLCWWAGDHFEQATQEESRRLGGIEHLWHLDNSYYRDRGGWSKDPLSPGQTAVVNLGDDTELAAYGPEGRGSFLIEMRKKGSEPITVFSLDVGSGLVSSSEYQHTFQGSK
jgi:hypothetical protein